MPEKELPMKNFLKTLIALTLATTFLLTGCDTTDVSDGVSSDVGEPTPEISPEDLALAEKAAVDFGVLHSAGVWESTKEIGPHMFYRWYIDYIASVTTYEERLERYKHENYEVGWSYPQEEFEAYIQKYFDVSVEHLRSDEYCYHAEDGIYNLEYIGAPNMRYEVQLVEESVTVDGDIMYIPIELSMDGFTEYRTLVIQKTEDGFKFLKVTD